MDIIDIILAKRLATGAAAPLIVEAKQAIQDANTAADAINDIIDDAETANAAAKEANDAADAANEKSQAIADTYDNLLAVVDQSMLADFESVIDEEIDKQIGGITDSIDTLQQNVSDISSAVSSLETNINDLSNDITNLESNAVLDVTTEESNDSAAKVRKIKVRKKSLETALELVKNYTSTGTNEDGSMTQKAITEKLNALEDKITNIPSSGSGGTATDLNLGAENAGRVVIVGNDGNIIPSTISQEELINVLIQEEAYTAVDAIGITIDYENRTFERTQEAIMYSEGADFDKYPMYGGRRRCNVNLNGQITAWYGNSNFKDDGSNGDVMVYQPKFYYQRRPIKTVETQVGKVIRKETIIITATKQAGFKVHPAFVDSNGKETDYILYPAYDNCYYDQSSDKAILDDSGTIDFYSDRLQSYSNAKPVSGLNNSLTIENAEQLARNHGSGWHIMNMAALSANQMLAIVELGTMNAQNAIEQGLSALPNFEDFNCASQSGSTSGLGNGTGAAPSTQNITNGNDVRYAENGMRAVTYRGYENPYGNIWQFIGGVNIYGNGNMAGGVPYICKDFNYTPNEIGDNYESVQFSLPSTYGWISGMGYGAEKYDWVFMPAEASTGTSALPVGDNLWTQANLNGINIVLFGGPHSHGEKNGLFYYACDKNYLEHQRNISARACHYPTAGSSVHITNYNSWLQQMGG